MVTPSARGNSSTGYVREGERTWAIPCAGLTSSIYPLSGSAEDGNRLTGETPSTPSSRKTATEWPPGWRAGEAHRHNSVAVCNCVQARG